MKKFSIVSMLVALGAVVTAWVLEEEKQVLKTELHLRDLNERRTYPCCGCDGAEKDRCDTCLYRCFASNLDTAAMLEVRQTEPVLKDCSGCLYNAFCFNHRNLKRVMGQGSERTLEKSVTDTMNIK